MSEKALLLGLFLGMPFIFVGLFYCAQPQHLWYLWHPPSFINFLYALLFLSIGTIIFIIGLAVSIRKKEGIDS